MLSAVHLHTVVVDGRELLPGLAVAAPPELRPPGFALPISWDH